eukprot:UN11990
MTHAQTVKICSKCSIELGADDRITVAPTVGGGVYGIVNNPLPDNNCPGGIGGHDVGPIGDTSYRNIKMVAYFIYFFGVIFIFLTIVKCTFVLVLYYNALKSNTMFNPFDIYSFIIVSMALLLWTTQRVPICQFDLLWNKIANCFSHDSTHAYSNHSNCIFRGSLFCSVDGLMKITVVKMVRRLFIGFLPYVIWDYYHKFSLIGLCVLLSYWILDIFFCLYEWKQTPDGKLCSY